MSQSECPLPAIQDELLLFTIAAKSVFHNASCAMVRKRRMSVSLFTFCWLIAMAAMAAGEQAKTCDASEARTEEVANESCAKEAPAKPAVNAESHFVSRFGVVFKASTLGPWS